MRKQRSALELGFDRYDVGRLQKLINQVNDKRTYIRVRSVQMVAEGKPISQVAAILNVTPQIIYRWIRIYLKVHQPQSLLDKPKKGRPRVAGQVTEKRILKELSGNPMRLGYFVNTWTVATLAQRLSSLYCPISPRTLYRRMKAMDLQCKRPKYFYEEKDRNRTQKKGLLFES